MQDMGSGVIASCCGTGIGVDSCRHHSSLHRFATNNATYMTTQARQRKSCVDDLEREIFVGQRSDVSYLAATLGVERCVIEEHFNAVVVTRNNSQHSGFCRIVYVANKRSGSVSLHDLAVCLDTIAVGATCFTSIFRTGALLVHFFLETFDVHLDTALARNFLREFKWETISIVQKECRTPRQFLCIGSEVIFQN